MVYPEVIDYIVAVAIEFVLIYVVTPVLYVFWFINMKPQVHPGFLYQILTTAGDLYFHVFQILGIVIIGITIFWYFANAAKQGTQDQQPRDYYY